MSKQCTDKGYTCYSWSFRRFPVHEILKNGHNGGHRDYTREGKDGRIRASAPSPDRARTQAVSQRLDRDLQGEGH